MNVELPEWKRRAIAVPLAALIALAFHHWSTGHFAQRVALTMPLHELGHAITGWLSGFTCVPTLWKTIIPETRGVLPPIVAFGGAGTLAYLGWRAERRWLIAVGAALAALAGYAITRPVDDAQCAITFMGDGGAMVLGALLMCLFFVEKLGSVRYGLLAIGAGAFVDTFSLWYAARRDTDVIPFGEIEGVGLSDPSKLEDVWDWSEHRIVHRYVELGTICLVALAAIYAWSVYAARRATADRGDDG